MTLWAPDRSARVVRDQSQDLQLAPKEFSHHVNPGAHGEIWLNFLNVSLWSKAEVRLVAFPFFVICLAGLQPAWAEKNSSHSLASG